MLPLLSTATACGLENDADVPSASVEPADPLPAIVVTVPLESILRILLFVESAT